MIGEEQKRKGEEQADGGDERGRASSVLTGCESRAETRSRETAPQFKIQIGTERDNANADKGQEGKQMSKDGRSLSLVQ